MYQIITFSRITLTTLVIVVCVGGDWLVELNSNSPIGKAAFDNITHAIVGLLSAAILFIQVEQRFSSFERIAAIATCFSISSLIDIDHFIVARTWTLSVCVCLNSTPTIRHFNCIASSNSHPFSECNAFATSTIPPLHHNSVGAFGCNFISG